MGKQRWWSSAKRFLTPWSHPVPPTVPWKGPITFRCVRCHEYHEDGPCPPPPMNQDEPAAEG